MAGAFSIVQVDNVGDVVLEADNFLLKLGEEFVKVIEIFMCVVLFEFNGSLAELADQVRFGSELVDSSGSTGSDSGYRGSTRLAIRR